MANETFKIFQHIRTKIIVHFANGWIDARYLKRGGMEFVLCCSLGECRLRSARVTRCR